MVERSQVIKTHDVERGKFSQILFCSDSFGSASVQQVVFQRQQTNCIWATRTNKKKEGIVNKPFGVRLSPLNTIRAKDVIYCLVVARSHYNVRLIKLDSFKFFCLNFLLHTHSRTQLFLMHDAIDVMTTVCASIARHRGELSILFAQIYFAHSHRL